ncbi:MAG TPA: outer membrane beta-barrel protein [Chthoniobacterales bacterium]|jgi:outer membrane immunogenic protein|nr:outer membrane beta-barrel protein [Chthoniobacterales bacterium]
MKRFFALTVVFLALISLAGVAKIALAGPEPLSSGKEMKEVAPAPPPCDWTGFYIGIHTGYSWGQLTWKDVDFGDNEILIQHNTDSPFYGGQLGYNRQFGSWLVLGIEGEFAWTPDAGGHKNTSSLSGEEEETKNYDTRSNWIGTIGGRLGVPFMNNRLLPYVKGGAAFEQWDYHSHASLINSSGTRTFENDFKTDETRVAPMIAVGLEYAFSCHWSVKAEYKHLFLGTDTITGLAQDPPGFDNESFDVKMDQDSVLAGLNFKF